MSKQQLKEPQATPLPMHRKHKPTKGWWRSKTVWFNLIASVGSLLASTLTKVIEVAPDVVPVLQPMMSVGTLGKVVAAVAIGNIFLRKSTHEPIGIKDTRPKPPYNYQHFQGARKHD